MAHLRQAAPIVLASILAATGAGISQHATAQTSMDGLSSSTVTTTSLDGVGTLAGNVTFSNARTAFDEGDIGKALPLFQTVAAENPDNDSAHLWLAKALMKQGGEDNYAKAKTHLIQALTINPDNPEALVELGTITGWDPSRRGEAISMLKHALALKDQSAYIQKREADITRQLVQQLAWEGDCQQAAAVAQPMRQAFATETKWQALYANLLARMGQAPQAIPLYEDYIKPFEQPANSEGLQWRMDYLYALRNAEQAPKARQLFNELAPTILAQQNDNLLNGLAGLAYDLGEYQTSLEATLQLSPELQQQRDTQLRTARTLVKLQNWPETIRLVDGLYQQGQLTSEEILEFADVYAGQQVSASLFPTDNYVAGMYQAAANSPKYANDADLQLRVARYLAQENGTATSTMPGMVDSNSSVSLQAADAYYQAVVRTNGNSDAIDELLGYLMSHQGPESTQMLGQLASEYPENTKVQASYAQMLTWDESTRLEGIQQLVNLAQSNPSQQDSYLELVDEALGWQSPSEEYKGIYQQILVLDPTHPAAQTGMAALMPQLPTVNQQQQPTYTAELPNTQPEPYRQTEPTSPWTVEQGMMTNGNSVMGTGYKPLTRMEGSVPRQQTQVQTRTQTQASLPPVNTSQRVITSIPTVTPQQNYPSTHASAPAANYSGSYKNWGSHTTPYKASKPNPPAYTPSTANGRQLQTTDSFLNNGVAPDAMAQPSLSRKAIATTNTATHTTYGTPVKSGRVGERYQFNPSTRSYSSSSVGSTSRLSSSVKPVVGQKPWETADQGSLTNRIEAAKQLTYDRQYSDALEQFDDVLQIDPGNRDARLGKAYALLWSGRKYASKRIVSKLLDENPGDIEAATAMVEIYKTMGRQDKAIKLLNEIRHRTSAHPTTNNLLSSLPATWDFQPIATTTMADWQLVPANYSNELTFSASQPQPPMMPAVASTPSTVPMTAEEAALQAELDALNAALDNIQDIQAKSESELSSLRHSVYQSKQVMNNPITTLETNDVLTQHFAKPMAEYFGQTLMAYDDPTRGGGYSELPEYLESRIGNLENSLYDDLRPELRVGYMFQTQDGNRDTNKLSTWGVPNQVSFSLLPQLRVRGGVIPQRYYLPDANIEPDSNFGLLYTAGFTAKPFDRVGIDGDFGVVRFSQSDKTNFNYRAVLTFDPWDRVRFKVGSRRLTLANSLLSISGFRPNSGAFAGENLGPANETSVFAELNLLPFNNVDVNLAYEWGAVTADGDSPTSYKNQVYASAGYTYRFNDKHWARLGYQFLYMGFSRNTINGFYDVTNFGATDPVVAFNPVTLSDPGYDFGGYFSPDHFFLNALRLDYRGSLFERFLEYQIGGSVGIQSFSHGNNIQDSSPTSVAYSADAAVRLNFTDWLAGYGRASYLDSGGFFSRYRLEAGLIIRPYIEALSPVIGDKMPKSDDFRKRDSQFPFQYDIFQHYY